MAKAKKPTTYYVTAGTSTRASADPDSDDFETWIDLAPGDEVTTFPEHAPVDEWLASGHWTTEKPEEPA